MSETTSTGVILSCVGGRYTVLSEGKRYSCYAKGTLRHLGIKPICGDEVKFVAGASFPDDGSPLPPSKENDGYLTAVLTRNSVLRRPPIANIDTLLIVVAAADPTPDLLYIDRLTVCAERAGITPIILCNKSDLDPSSAEAIVSLYRQVGYQAYSMSAREDGFENLQLLKHILKGKRTAMAGFSGVGKTTFFNRLFPHEQGEVGSLSQKLSRGKNTTRTTKLHSLTRSVLSCNGLFADTAGFSRLDLGEFFDINVEDLPFYFPEFSEYLGTCRFTKCSHKSELGCAILEAINDSKLPPSRHRSYRALLEEIQNA